MEEKEIDLEIFLKRREKKIFPIVSYYMQNKLNCEVVLD